MIDSKTGSSHINIKNKKSFTTQQFVLTILLLIFSIISGYLLSKPSLVGRIGISLFYKQYQILKTWWKGALLIFILLMILLAIQRIIQIKVKPSRSKLIYLIFIIAEVTGLYLTYYNFRHTTTHRWLGERFHIGAYLFWIESLMISIFYLLTLKSNANESIDCNNLYNTNNIQTSA